MDAQYIGEKLDRLNEEKKDLKDQLEYETKDSIIEELEEQLRDLEHSIKIVQGWKPNE